MNPQKEENQILERYTADGTGGGHRYQEIEERFDRLSQVMSAYNLLLMAAAGGGAISGLGATSLGIVALYGHNWHRCTPVLPSR